MERQQPVTFRAERNLIQRAGTVAMLKNISRSELVRLALIDFLRRYDAENGVMKQVKMRWEGTDEKQVA